MSEEVTKAAAVSQSAPTQQISVSRQSGSLSTGGRDTIAGLAAPWTQFIDDKEFVPKLVWPGSQLIFEQMRTDSQIAGLYFALTAPIMRYKWVLDPNGADDRIVQKLSRDYNLPIKGGDAIPKGRTKKRFSFRRHLAQALKAAGFYGYRYFEQLGTYEADGLWHIRKLVMIRNINQINLADDGGLISVRQIYSGPTGYPREIPVDHLVAYVFDQEFDGDWIGRPLQRDLYKNWLLKDRLMRVDAINHEHAGGVPWIEAPQGTPPKQVKELQAAAEQFRVGEDSAATLVGAKLNLAKVGGGTDAIESVRYHDQAMARRLLHMFLELGQTQTGSRALGETFVDYAFLAQNAVANWFMDTFNEHVIEDDVDWNFGEDVSPVPLLAYEVDPENAYLSLADMATAVAQGLITVDPELEDYLRSRYHLPKRGGQPTG